MKSRNENIMEWRARWMEREDARANDRANRRDARSKRTPTQQLAVLDKRLGHGVGAVRERDRLQKKIKV